MAFNILIVTRGESKELSEILTSIYSPYSEGITFKHLEHIDIERDIELVRSASVICGVFPLSLQMEILNKIDSLSQQLILAKYDRIEIEQESESKSRGINYKFRLVELKRIYNILINYIDIWQLEQ